MLADVALSIKVGRNACPSIRISFAEAKHVFDGPVLTRIDDRADYGEVRELSLGLLSPDAPLMVVHTARGEKIRLISARKASRRERVIYDDYLERTFETD